MKNIKHIGLSALLAATLVLVACSTAQIATAEAEATAAAETAENVLETVNTDTGGGVTLLTQSLVNKALISTHNAGDQAVVDAAIAEGAAALKVQVAAQSAGLSSTDAQTLTTAVLVSPTTTIIGATAAAPAIPANAAVTTP